MFSIIAIFLIILIPFATFYYDANDGTEETQKCSKRFCHATVSEICVLIIALLVLLSTYFTAGSTNIPITQYSSKLSSMTVHPVTAHYNSKPSSFIDLSISENDVALFTVLVSKSSGYITYPVDFPVYVVALVGWIGWWLFAAFCGTGLLTLPYDFIAGFVKRPKPLTPDELAKMQIALQKRTADLMDLSMVMKQERKDFLRSGPTAKEKKVRWASDQLEFNQLARMVYVLDLEYHHLQECKVVKDGFNPLIPYVSLGAGIISLGLSGLWMAHIVLFILMDPPKSLFLNDFFSWFDLWFPMFGTLFYGIFAMYLFCCTVKGCFKLGMKLLCMSIHPMKLGETYIDALLFNAAIVMLCTFPVVHFCAIAFAGYAQYTDLVQLFNVQIRYLHFFSQFYVNNVFIYILFLTVPVSFLWMLCSPKPKADEETATLKLEVMRKGGAL
jgi:LMBR1 domain-containing protein 1